MATLNILPTSRALTGRLFLSGTLHRLFSFAWLETDAVLFVTASLSLSSFDSLVTCTCHTRRRKFIPTHPTTIPSLSTRSVFSSHIHGCKILGNTLPYTQISRLLPVHVGKR
eukprot:2882679-Amphidinium_carterae.2